VPSARRPTHRARHDLGERIRAGAVELRPERRDLPAGLYAQLGGRRRPAPFRCPERLAGTATGGGYLGLMTLTTRGTDAPVDRFDRCGHWAQIEHAAELNRPVTSFVGVA
jgi:hypothetical protein